MKPDKEKQSKNSASKKPNGKVFDVSRPGKAAASPTSKPVILGHRPEAQAAQTSVSGVGEARPLLSKRKIEITPLGGTDKPESEIPATEQLTAADTPKTPETELTHAQPTPEETEALAATALDAVTGPPELHQEKSPTGLFNSPKLNLQPPSETERPADEPVAAEEKEEEPAEAELESEPAPETEPEAESAPESSAESTVKPEPQLAEKELPAESSSMPEAEPVKETDEKEEPAPEPVIEPLFDDSGAVVVSNHDHHHHHHGLKVFLMLLLILILAAAALDIALDLGLLNLPNLPHTDFL